MPVISSVAYVAATSLSLVYFGFAKRRFDLLTVAFIGVCFYFSPLYFGYVIEPGPTDVAIPEPVYWIGTGFMLLLLAGAWLSDQLPATVAKPGSTRLGPLSPWYAGGAAVCLAIALIQSRGAIINIDKVAVLKQVGYAYAAFEIAACLALLAAIVERRPWIGAFAILLLTFDIFIGFRFYTVFAALVTPVLIFRSEAPFRMWRKWLTLGCSAAVFVIYILLAHTARQAVFNAIDEHAVTSPSQMRADTLQYLDSTKSPSTTPKWFAGTVSTPRWLAGLVDIFLHSEQFQTQTVLVETVRQNYVCERRNILKSLTLLVPPGIRRFVDSPYPETFYDEYQPVLFPTLTYGLGGNIWAEMLCRFGYVGDAIFAVILLGALIGLDRLIQRAPPALAPTIALAGAVLAFYIHRNDLSYTLVMLRQIAIVSAVAFLVAWLSAASSWSRSRTAECLPHRGP